MDVKNLKTLNKDLEILKKKLKVKNYLPGSLLAAVHLKQKKHQDKLNKKSSKINLIIPRK